MRQAEIWVNLAAWKDFVGLLVQFMRKLRKLTRATSLMGVRATHLTGGYCCRPEGLCHAIYRNQQVTPR